MKWVRLEEDTNSQVMWVYGPAGLHGRTRSSCTLHFSFRSSTAVITGWPIGRYCVRAIEVVKGVKRGKCPVMEKMREGGCKMNSLLFIYVWPSLLLPLFQYLFDASIRTQKSLSRSPGWSCPPLLTLMELQVLFLFPQFIQFYLVMEYHWKWSEADMVSVTRT